MLSRYALLFPLYAAEVSPERVEVYLECLSDLSIDDLAYGLTEAAKRATEFPTPGYIRKCIDSRGDSSMEAEQALAHIDNLIELWGADKMPEWRNGGLEYPPELPPASKSALQAIGGWQEYALRTLEASPFYRKNFIAAYQRYSGREIETGQIESGSQKMLDTLSEATIFPKDTE